MLVQKVADARSAGGSVGLRLLVALASPVLSWPRSPACCSHVGWPALAARRRGRQATVDGCTRRPPRARRTCRSRRRRRCAERPERCSRDERGPATRVPAVDFARAPHAADGREGLCRSIGGRRGAGRRCRGDRPRVAGRIQPPRATGFRPPRPRETRGRRLPDRRHQARPRRAGQAGGHCLVGSVR